MCVGGIWAFDKPNQLKGDRSEPPVAAARLRHGATVTVVAQQHDWLKVRLAPCPRRHQQCGSCRVFVLNA